MPAFHIVLLFGFGEHPVGFIVALAILLALGRMLYGIFRDGTKIVKQEQILSGNVQYSGEAVTAIDFQLRNFTYYKKLSLNGRKAFIQRVLNFMGTHTIDGENNFTPALPDKIDVAAAATQLTFGLSDFMFAHFDTVILYPGIFRINENAPLMKGATSPNGVIRISIKDFDAGYANPSDKLNVGLHEFAHALFMELLKDANAEELEDAATRKQLERYIEISDKMLHEGKDAHGFLRDYAFTNRHEFFAVGIEHFFEAPYEFKEKLPQLYGAFKNLLQQDTAGALPDYGVSWI